jgi:hypothetical protein
MTQERTKYTFNVELGNRGLWYATSPDVNGLLVAEYTLEDCLGKIAPTLEGMALAGVLARDTGK